MAVLIAPTEPPTLRNLGTCTLLPEKYGCDIAWVAHGEWWGVQRKELSDFIASLYDGRLSKELAQMKQIHQAVLVIEGQPRYTTDGQLITRQWGKPITRKQIDGFLWSVRSQGVWVDWTTNLADTVGFIERLEAWSRKEKHTGLVSRPGPQTGWGVADNRDFAIHLLMGLPGVGKELAERILDHFGGMPWAWTCSKGELMEVKGLGEKKAGKIWQALEYYVVKDGG